MVYGLKYNISFSSNALAAASCYVFFRDIDTALTSERNVRERPFVKKAWLSASTGGQAVKTLKGYANVKTILNLPKISPQNNIYTGLTGGTGVGSSPEKQAFLFTAVSSTDNLASVNVIVRVELTYYAVMYERQQPPTS